MSNEAYSNEREDRQEKIILELNKSGLSYLTHRTPLPDLEQFS